jgi:hypothetical protein
MKNPANTAAEKFIRKAGFKVTPYHGNSYKLYDEGGICATIVDLRRSVSEDKVMLVVDKLSGSASNFGAACDKLDGQVIHY